MNYRIGICDTDSHYSVGLMEYINMHAELPLKCSVFSSADSVNEHAVREGLDLILLDENIGGSVAMDIPVVRTTVKRQQSDGERVIYKYQSADGIAEALLRVLNNGKATKSDEQRFYAVYSPLGRCGKTRLSMAICRCHGNSLYVGLEDYCAYTAGIADTDTEDFAWAGDFLYHLISKNEKAFDCIRECGQAGDGFTVIKAAQYFADGRQLCAEHVNWFRNVLNKEGCERVVFDINTGAMSDISLLEAFDAVFVPALHDGISRSKLLLFHELAGKGVYKLPEEKLKEVYVPDGAYDSAALCAFVKNSGM